MRKRGRPLDLDCLETRTCLSTGATTAAATSAAATAPAPSLASTTPVITPIPASQTLTQSEMNIAPGPKPNVAFFGDSISNYFEYDAGSAVWNQKIAPLGAVDYGVPGDMTQNLLWRLENTQILNNPPRVAVVEIGVNNIKFGDEPTAEVVAGIEAVVSAIREQAPHTKILLLGVFPTDTADSANRAEEAAVNQAISGLANGRQIRYLDAGASYLGADGSVDAFTTNELHPTDEGYELVADALTPVLRQMLGR